MSIRRLIYIANARLPTEKAHGYQICKMCEAFAESGAEVQLWHPYRHQPDGKLRAQSVFDFYGIRRLFQVKTFRTWDPVRLSSHIPERWFTRVFFANAVILGLYAALRARREKAEIFYTRDIATAYWLTKLGLPTAYEAHVVPKRAQRDLLRRIARSSALRLVVVLTSFIKEEFLKMGFPDENIAVLPDSVDLSLFADLPNKKECRERLGLPVDRLIVGYIGRFRTMDLEKGIPELVQAMTYFRSPNGKEPLLLCVGGPMDAVPAYLDLARRLGVNEAMLRFVDLVPNREVPFWMRACDVVTIPWGWTEFSAYYTSPLKLFEYLAAGVPIVASDLPSIREVLQHGENAWIVECGRPSALAEGIKAIVDNRRIADYLAKRASSDARRYTWLGRARAILGAI